MKKISNEQLNKVKGGYNGALEYTPVQNGKEHTDTLWTKHDVYNPAGNQYDRSKQ